MNAFPTNLSLVDRNHVVKPRLHPAYRPLGAKDLITKLYLFLLLMQFIMLSKKLRCLFTTVGSNIPEKLGQLDDSVRSQLMQPDLKFHYYLHQSRVRRHAHPDNEVIFENNSFIPLSGFDTISSPGALSSPFTK
jgi:hypothetical protein